MQEALIEQHISEKFNKELRELRNQVLRMGGLVEEQLANAITALTSLNEKLAKEVYTNDYKINALEVEIDEECTRILALRQPTARDLRLVMAVVKTIPDLERIGDQAERIAQMALKIPSDRGTKHFLAIRHLGDDVQKMLYNALDAFARLDIETALQVMHQESKVDQECDTIARQLMTYMMEDPRTIPIILNILWSTRALERVAAHSRNICEYLIYFVKGKDVRHISLEQAEVQARQAR